MINLHDLDVNIASKDHNERIKHAQMLYNFTPNKHPQTQHFARLQAKKQSHFPKSYYLNKIDELHEGLHGIRLRVHPPLRTWRILRDNSFKKIRT